MTHKDGWTVLMSSVSIIFVMYDVWCMMISWMIIIRICDVMNAVMSWILSYVMIMSSMSDLGFGELPLRHVRLLRRQVRGIVGSPRRQPRPRRSPERFEFDSTSSIRPRNHCILSLFRGEFEADRAIPRRTRSSEEQNVWPWGCERRFAGQPRRQTRRWQRLTPGSEMSPQSRMLW